jgi:regulatory protein
VSSPAYHYALKLLVRREQSAFELRQKLALKDYSEDEIVDVISTLQTQGYQSDERFAELIVRTRTNQGKGKLLIAAELKQHQIPNPEDYLQDIDFKQLCQQVKNKKFGTQKPKDIKDKQKQMRFLQGRGFSFDEINKIIK